MSTIKVDTITTRTGSGNITASNTIVGNVTGNLTGNLTGNSTVGGTLTSTGLITASAGVAVGGTGSANTLDDYEEGTFTPILGAISANPTVGAYQYQVGFYRKVGRVVTASIYLRIAGGQVSGGSGDGSIQGLPFTTANSGNISYSAGGFAPSWMKTNGSFSTGRNRMLVMVQPNEAAVRLWQEGGASANNMTGWGIAQIDDGELIVSGVLTYFTDT